MAAEKLYQTKRSIPVVHEYTKWDFVKSSKEPPARALPDEAGDCDKFQGFFRRMGEPLKADREAHTLRLEQRLASHDQRRRPHLTETISRNGFDPVVGQEVDAAKDNFRPRGTVHIDDQGGAVRAVEVALRERETEFRFFRIEDPRSPRIAHRAKLLVDAGLRGANAQRMSSTLGYGRKDLPSTGAAEAFSLAEYGGELRSEDYAQALASATAEHSSSSSSSSEHAGAPSAGLRTDIPFFLQQGPRDVWDVGAVDPQTVRRREMASLRAPNRVFDTTSPAVILHALPDPVRRALRENDEILRARPPRPVDRPASFTAQATLLATQRVRRAKESEVDLVRRLPPLRGAGVGSD